MSLEGRGIPTAILCPEEFQALARARLEAAGFPPARVVTLPHPLAGLAPEAVHGRAAAPLADIVRASSAPA